ncbi:MAG: Asp-tRNA(Asn)/Glu-tRNA(Gln) amidotransferase subunit GatB [Acidobacteria bacterium]|nr:Asp-tRNA(Asn)/Glu-tRNA(Gln) amidotransferase subunit GatB [Acidobacteriota bacterium]
MDLAVIPIADPETVAKYEPVIGLEVHCQLKTKTKIFSPSSHEFGNPANTQTDPVVLGLPGALPVLNREAVEQGVRASLAIHCKINRRSVFARKNYFYPDLPKGYQISQYDEPLAEHGWLDVDLEDGSTKRIGITRLHLEEDAGKTIHDGFRDSDQYSYVDLNRAGAPLAEIVSEPDMRSSEEAFAYLTEIKQALQFAGVSDCDMEKGQLRCDANVSVRLKGEEKFGVKAEIKNVNSFRFVKMAIEYEIARQVAVLESGALVVQETRLFNNTTGETSSMRSKEEAHDYRYFPEPDLPPLLVSEEWERSIADSMPELPRNKRERLVSEYGVSDYDARVLALSAETADYFETVAKASGDAKMAANWVQGELAGALNAAGKTITESPISAESLARLLKLLGDGTLSSKLAKEVFAKMFESGKSADEIIEAEGLKQISDTGALESIIDGILAANPKQVETYRGGKVGILGFFVGQVMKQTKGQANPQVVNELLTKKLAG